MSIKTVSLALALSLTLSVAFGLIPGRTAHAQCGFDEDKNPLPCEPDEQEKKARPTSNPPTPTASALPTITLTPVPSPTATSASTATVAAATASPPASNDGPPCWEWTGLVLVGLALPLAASLMGKLGGAGGLAQDATTTSESRSSGAGPAPAGVRKSITVQLFGGGRLPSRAYLIGGALSAAGGLAGASFDVSCDWALPAAGVAAVIGAGMAFVRPQHSA